MYNDYDPVIFIRYQPSTGRILQFDIAKYKIFKHREDTGWGDDSAGLILDEPHKSLTSGEIIGGYMVENGVLVERPALVPSTTVIVADGEDKAEIGPLPAGSVIQILPPVGERSGTILEAEESISLVTETVGIIQVRILDAFPYRNAIFEIEAVAP